MIKSSDDERRIGIEVFYTNVRGIGGKLRKNPEDFIVEEISSPLSKDDDGEYTIARIKVKNWETNRLIRQLSRRLGISRKRIGFAGTKDRRAVTTQLFSIKAPIKDVRKLSLKDFEILEIYTSRQGLDLGDLLGNRFDIIIKGIEVPDLDANKSISDISEELESLKGFPNFFGHQRFGAVRPITHIVGKKIIEGDFKGAVHIYIGNPVDIEGAEAFEARKTFEEGGSFADVLELFPKYFGFEKALLNHLIKKEGDYIGALNALPKNLSMMFVHAYQSYIFNRILSQRIEKGLLTSEPLIGDIVIPMDKSGLPDHKKWIEVTDDNINKISKRVREKKAAISGLVPGSNVMFAKGRQGEIEEKVVEDEGVSPKDFIIPQMRRLSSKGIRREFVSPLSDFVYEIGDGGIRMQFTLQKGCYATALLREFMKTDMLSY
ncbi:MAG: tRNA pseudouridine(13) synthase TruD [Thermoplasmata archaeon]|nr:MAG: tRNA pseudouridine(13) synthase TruD [Thermoplasmata archaeon]